MSCDLGRVHGIVNGYVWRISAERVLFGDREDLCLSDGSHDYVGPANVHIGAESFLEERAF